MNAQSERLPLDEAARRLHTTPLNVLMHLKRGLLDGVELEDGGWEVEAASLAALQAKTGGLKADDICSSGCASRHACGGGCS